MSSQQQYDEMKYERDMLAAQIAMLKVITPRMLADAQQSEGGAILVGDYAGGYDLCKSIDTSMINSAMSSGGTQLIAERDELKAERDALAAKTKMLDDHINRMQELALKYILPDGDVSDSEFIEQMIYLLDGPEQRKAQRAISQEK